jgi:hypothetical protein
MQPSIHSSLTNSQNGRIPHCLGDPLARRIHQHITSPFHTHKPKCRRAQGLGVERRPRAVPTATTREAAAEAKPMGGAREFGIGAGAGVRPRPPRDLRAAAGYVRASCISVYRPFHRARSCCLNRSTVSIPARSPSWFVPNPNTTTRTHQPTKPKPTPIIISQGRASASWTSTPRFYDA